MSISAVYKIVNTVTGDCYVGSSKNVKSRWAVHKCSSTWKIQLNNLMYSDMQTYGVDKFRFQILCPVEPEHLKEVEQELIDMLHPTYNSIRANGRNVERLKECKKKCCKKWRQTEKGKEYNRKQARIDMKKYYNQLCFYNGETLKLNTLSARFRKDGIKHPTVEAKKYLLTQ